MPLSSPRFNTNARIVKAAENKPAMGFGEIGEAVRIIQQSLVELGFWMDISFKKFNTPDGIFGAETEKRVREFQSKQSLFIDGIVGKDTMARLDALLPTAGPALPVLPKKVDFQHRVRVHTRSLDSTNVPMSHQEANARIAYAQYGIYFDVLSRKNVTLSKADRDKFLSVDVGECVDNKLTTELADLHKVGLEGVGPNEIVIYFAKEVVDDGGKKINGCAAINSDRPAVVVASTGTPWTLAHEVGHVLLETFEPVHMDSDTTNLMHAPTAEITTNPPGLTPDQLKAIRTSKFITKY